MKIRYFTAISLSMVFLIGPGSPAHAGGGGCSFTPSEFEVEIDPALLEVDGPIDPTDPAIMDLFDPMTVDYSFAESGYFSGPTGYYKFTVVAGGTTYRSLTPFGPAPSDGASFSGFRTSIPWVTGLPEAGQLMLDMNIASFVSDFPDISNWTSALRNPDKYPISWEIGWAAADGDSPACSLTFVYTLGERGDGGTGDGGWDIDLDHFFTKTERSLPDTL